MALVVLIVSGTILFGLMAVFWYGTRNFRSLPDSVCAEIAKLPERRENQHLVDLQLRDGRVVRKVWVAYGRYPAVFGGRTLLRRYRPDEVVRALPHEG